MIDTVSFQNDRGEWLFPYEQYGIIMKTHVISPPKPKVHRFSLDGMDGDLDATEWAGEVRYEPRTAEISFRDMSAEQYEALVQFVLGRNVKIFFSEAQDLYLYGRCEKLGTETRDRVTDLDLSFTCKPYRFARFLTTVSLTVDTSGETVLCARRMSAKPTIVTSAAMTLSFGGTTYNLDSGTSTPNMTITDQPQTLTITGSGTISITWQDGVL